MSTTPGEALDAPDADGVPPAPATVSARHAWWKGFSWTKVAAIVVGAGAFLGLIQSATSLSVEFWNSKHHTTQFAFTPDATAPIRVTRQVRAVTALQNHALPCPEAATAGTEGVEADFTGTGSGSEGASVVVAAGLEDAHEQLLRPLELSSCRYTLSHQLTQPSVTVKYWFPMPRGRGPFRVRIEVANPPDQPVDYKSAPFA